jgi:hypothetical protein
MHRFIDGEDRRQPALLPHSLEDYVGEENPVRVIEVFIDELDLAAIGFSGMTPAAWGRLSSLDAAEDLPLWLPQPHSVEPAAGTGSATQYRVDVAGRAARSRLQDDCRLPQGWRGDPDGVFPVCGAVPVSWACSPELWLPLTAASSKR